MGFRGERDCMNAVNKLRILTTITVLLSLALGRWLNPIWFWVAVLIGVNFIQSAFSGFCPGATLLRMGPKGDKDLDSSDD